MCSINLESCLLFNIPRRKPPTPLPPPLSRGAEDWLAYSSPRITLLHSKTFLLVSRHKCIIIFQWWKKFSSPVTPILETKGHKTLLKELFMYYVSAKWGMGGRIQIGCEWRSEGGLIMTITRWSPTSLTTSAAGLFSLHVHNSVNQAEKIENRNLGVGASRF